MPVRDILVCDTRSHVEHDDTTLSVDVVAITKTTKLLLTSGIPDIELDLTKVLVSISCLHVCVVFAFLMYRGETERMDFDTKRRDVLLLKFAGQMAFDESCLLSRLEPMTQLQGVAWMRFLTLPVPPSPTRTSLNVGVPEASAIVLRF
jgi:hypothetical protein